MKRGEERDFSYPAGGLYGENLDFICQHVFPNQNSQNNAGGVTVDKNLYVNGELAAGVDGKHRWP